MSDVKEHSKKTSLRDPDPEWCGVDDKKTTARNRRRAEQKIIEEELLDVCPPMLPIDEDAERYVDALIFERCEASRRRARLIKKGRWSV